MTQEERIVAGKQLDKYNKMIGTHRKNRIVLLLMSVFWMLFGVYKFKEGFDVIGAENRYDMTEQIREAVNAPEKERTEQVLGCMMKLKALQEARFEYLGTGIILACLGMIMSLAAVGFGSAVLVKWRENEYHIVMASLIKKMLDEDAEESSSTE